MLVGSEVQLVPIEERHLDYMMEHVNNVEMRVLLGSFMPTTRSMQKEWIGSVSELIKKRQGFHLAIEKIPEAIMIGSLVVYEIDWLSRSGELAIAVYEEKNWNKGYGSEAMRLLIDFAWTHLNLRRLELAVHSHNPRALHVYEKIGFKHYGTAHEKYYIDGQFVDTDYLELFRDS
ncbi:MAG: GNAT family N-acetyltransferase [Candidatus Thorarchaeota archaeon]